MREQPTLAVEHGVRQIADVHAQQAIELLLDRVKQLDPSIFTKSGIMVGLGEQRIEVLQVMDDMHILRRDC